MNKWVAAFLVLCTPVLVFADGSSISFAPPPSDWSIVFLGDLFGVVDGVLHGTGSQIMGAIFGVFNSAILALGGIVIMYTLLVSTMNTAHEGEVLGSKWSSIWVPMRSALGMSLLIPKASGYCVMQILFMSIVVQGVGAADKIWNAALNYLNRGGVIVQPQQNSSQSFAGANSQVQAGATYLLSAEVCMLGIQTALKLAQQTLQQQTIASPCTGALQTFCNTPIPDFIGSVNFVSIQQSQSSSQGLPASGQFSATLPAFPSNTPFAILNGICGTFTWHPVNIGGQSLQSALNATTAGARLAATIGSAGLEAASLGRAIAIQQMYLDLSSIAQVMISNNPILTPPQSNGQNTTPNFSSIAVSQYGVPYMSTGQACQNAGRNCVSWGSDPNLPSGNNTAPLFSGTEFQGAMEDYSGIILPTLNLINQFNNISTATNSRQFIQDAEANGWVMAGAYFFNLSQLSATSEAQANLVDNDTGFPTGYSLSNILEAFSQSRTSTCAQGGGGPGYLCTVLNNNVPLVKSIIGMVDGSYATPAASLPLSYSKAVPSAGTAFAQKSVLGPPLEATVYGFIINSGLVQLPGQPGLTAPQFSLYVSFDAKAGVVPLPWIDFGCGSVSPFFTICLGEILGYVFYDVMFRTIYNYFINELVQIIDSLLLEFMIIPFTFVTSLLKAGIQAIQNPYANPIIALAQMGIQFINEANNFWITVTSWEILANISIIGMLALWPIMVMALPIIAAWLSTMVVIGFNTAYYIPLLPYMIFTFGGIAWLMAVIEAMVAAPIVALGVTHPEGHEAFGKGEHAIMIILNIFLRPSMMIIGYISAIALSFVSIWIINAGFTQAMQFIQGGSGSQLNYTNWAGLYAVFFSILIYVTMYTVVVQKSFSLITDLPDKVLRWVGGAPESTGGNAAQWTEKAEGAVKEGGASTQKAQGAVDKAAAAGLQKIAKKAGGGGSSGSADASSGKPPGGDGGGSISA